MGINSLSDITKILSINTAQIKDNLKIGTKINFLEVRTESLSELPEHTDISLFGHKQTCSIELSRANGLALKISLLPLESL